MSAESGPDAITQIHAAGFRTVSKGPNGSYAPLRYETRHELAHPDGRVLLLLTGPGGDFIRARALNSHRWSACARRSAGSVPAVLRMLDSNGPSE